MVASRFSEAKAAAGNLSLEFFSARVAPVSSFLKHEASLRIMSNPFLLEQVTCRFQPLILEDLWFYSGFPFCS
jgi:hypothetical protein